MLRSVSAETATALPPASCDCTVMENGLPAAGLAGLIEVIASFDATPAVTGNGALSAEAKPVEAAVMTTPLSAFVYVTPLMVT